MYNYFYKFKKGKSSDKIESKINKTLKEISSDVEEFKHNITIIKIRSLFYAFENESISKGDAESFLKMLHVYCPFLAEELWNKIGNKGFISVSKWPEYNEKKINEKFEEAEKAFDKTMDDILEGIGRYIKKEPKKRSVASSTPTLDWYKTPQKSNTAKNASNTIVICKLAVRFNNRFTLSNIEKMFVR